MINLSGQDTRHLSKNEYDIKNKQKLKNLQNYHNSNMNNVSNYKNSNNNMPTLDISKMLNNYNKLKNNNNNFSISNNEINKNNIKFIPQNKPPPMIFTDNSNSVPPPLPYPQESEFVSRPNPVIDNNFKVAPNPLTNNSTDKDLHKILNKDINFKQNPLTIPKFLPEQINPPTNKKDNTPYLAEIGEKRKLSNIIYNSILKSFKNIEKSSISEYEINHILHKLNIDESNNNWSKDEVKNFAKEVKSMIVYKSAITNENINQDNLISDSLYEKETKEIDYIININSIDRDLKIWPNPNEFMVIFGPDNNLFYQEILDEKKKNAGNLPAEPLDLFSSENGQKVDTYHKTKGYISRAFSNISKVELLEVIVPKCTYSSKDNPNPDNYDEFPYILVEIPELGSVYEGTSTLSSEAFATLTYSETRGNYRYYMPHKYNPIVKYFNPRIGLSKMTIKIKKPYTFVNQSSELFNFGGAHQHYFTDCSKDKEKTDNTIKTDSEDIYYKEETVDKGEELNCLEKQSTSLNLCDDYDNLPSKLPCIEKKTGKIRKKKEKYIKNYCYSDTQNSKDYSKTIPPNIVLIFKITCLQKSLDTMFLA